MKTDRLPDSLIETVRQAGGSEEVVQALAARWVAILGDTQLSRTAYQVHQTWCWALGQLKVLAEMLADRAAPDGEAPPLPAAWLAAEAKRIRDGVMLLPQGLLHDPPPPPQGVARLLEEFEQARLDAVRTAKDPESEGILEALSSGRAGGLEWALDQLRRAYGLAPPLPPSQDPAT